MSEDIAVSTAKSLMDVNPRLHVFIIGLGGIGSWIVEPIIRYVNSTLGNREVQYILIDGDKYGNNNMDRQVCHPKFIGENKSIATAIRMRSYFPDVDIIECPFYLGPNNGSRELISSSSASNIVIINCVDNNVCRKHVDNAVHVKGMGYAQNLCSITVGNELTDGNAHIRIRGRITREEDSLPVSSLQDIHPEVWDADDGDRSTMSCEELESLPGGGQIVITNFMAAAHALQLFYKYMELIQGKGKLNVRETFFDIVSCAANAVSHDGR